MKIKSTFIFLLSAVFIVSCASNKIDEEIPGNQEEFTENFTNENETIDNNIIDQTSDETLKPDETSNDDSNDIYVYEDDEIEFLDDSDELSEEDLILERLNNMTVSLISSPKETRKLKEFAEPYVISVKDLEGNPIVNYPFTVSYPISRLNDDYTYDYVTVLTDENGLITFKPEKPKISANDKILFEPEAEIYYSEKVSDKLSELAVYADYKVKASINSAVLFIWDYNELNKPMGNSYEMISAFRKKNLWNVGNAPVNETSDIGKSADYLYNANYEIIGNSFEYLIGGTIKFTKRVEKVEDGYEAALIAEIYAIDMNNGKEIYRTVIENSAVGANWNKAVDKSKTELADKIVDTLYYSL